MADPGPDFGFGEAKTKRKSDGYNKRTFAIPKKRKVMFHSVLAFGDGWWWRWVGLIRKYLHCWMILQLLCCCVEVVVLVAYALPLFIRDDERALVKCEVFIEQKNRVGSIPLVVRSGILYWCMFIQRLYSQ